MFSESVKNFKTGLKKIAEGICYMADGIFEFMIGIICYILLYFFTFWKKEDEKI